MVVWLLLLTIANIATAGEIGTYPSSDKGMPCHSSCKECTNETQCTECEEYMFLNTTTGLGQFGPDGEFYDGTITRGGRSCEGSCFGQGGYQTSCMQCPSGQAFDLDTMTCVSSGDADK